MCKTIRPTKDFERLIGIVLASMPVLCALWANWSTSYWDQDFGQGSRKIKLFTIIIRFVALLLLGGALVCKRFNFFQVLFLRVFFFLFGQAILSPISLGVWVTPSCRLFFAHKNWISCTFRADCLQGSSPISGEAPRISVVLKSAINIQSHIFFLCCFNGWLGLSLGSGPIRNITTALPAECRHIAATQHVSQAARLEATK